MSNITTSNAAIRFLAKYPQYSVVLTNGRQLTDPMTGLPGQIVQSKIIRFSRGFYESRDRETALQMLSKLFHAKTQRLSVGFCVHPEDEQLAEALWEASQKQIVDPGATTDNQELELLRQQNATLMSQIEQHEKASTAKQGKRTKNEET